MIRGWTSLKRRLGRSPVLSEPSSEDTLQTAHTTIASSDDKVTTWMKVQEDGFFRYSSSIYSQEESQSPNGSPGKASMQRPLSPIAPLFSSSPSGKSLMAPPRRHSRPYKVSSDDWVVSSEALATSGMASEVMGMDDLNTLQIEAHMKGALKVFVNIYTLAKISHVAFLAYGAEIGDSKTGLLHWIKRAEAGIRTGSLSNLIEIVENLFYALYARVVLEMAAIELCMQFKMEPRPRPECGKFYLPEPDHMYRIFLAIKDVLDSPTICERLYEFVVNAYQDSHLCSLVDQNVGTKFNLDDPTGYRRYVLGILNERNSQFNQKWGTLLPYSRNFPAELAIAISEKYCTVEPKVQLESDVPTDKLPFVDLKIAHFSMWAKDHTEDCRLASLGSLEGKMLGEMRRDDGKPLLPLVQQHKCVCIPLCRCAGECTACPERHCPCSERQLRMMLARNRKGLSEIDFTTRANTLARASFERLAILKRNIRDGQLMSQLVEVVEGFELEILKERSSGSSNFSI
ncbi:hypothetical protein N7481_004775 [Penicillium waksmanii]|uniref:uncharacterized protein n=1 Tax=Penicillium waksmanii TaxID=69791 RepID=UPI002546B846|nr:uncharacterized protein N7481_004775 [Penicillium waksmanii]KAJ5989565.1 hypothetical protein N7481_004775 [Penicillium waksmanii]